MAPAHPQATGVAVYSALLIKSEALGVNIVRFCRYLYCNYGFVNRPFKDALDDLLQQI